MIQILIIGTNRPIMETIARLIDKNEKWKATIAASVVEACERCREVDFKLALIGAGLPESEELSLKAALRQFLPELPVVKHFGGGSGLLYAEIYEGLK